jgi:hypothetical protein
LGRTRRCSEPAHRRAMPDLHAGVRGAAGARLSRRLSGRTSWR